MAIGNALSQAAGFRAMHGSLCTPLMPAQAAQTGLRAALLAQAGFTSSATPLDGGYGFLSVFSDVPDLDALAGGLGQRFDLLRNTYKPYPCGIVIHPIIDACLNCERRTVWTRRSSNPQRLRRRRERWHCVTTAPRRTRCRRI
jgi:2-methylcitrate dehydratase PrpD